MSDLVQSARDFEHTVWPILGTILGGGDLRPCESSNEQIAPDFDREAGIDWYHLLRDRPIRAIASRVQWQYRDSLVGPAWRHPWNTFSIRERTAYGNNWTELAKRVDAYTSNALMPSLVVQAYLEREGGPVQTVGVVDARGLYRYVCDCVNAGREFARRTNGDGSRFIAVPFKEVDCWCWFSAIGWQPDPQLSFLGVEA